MNFLKNHCRKLIALSVTALFAACSPTVYNIASWANKDKIIAGNYQKIYILSMMNNATNNIIIENDFANEGARRGIVSVKNSQVMTQTYTDRTISKEETLNKAKAEGCDAIFTVGLLDVKSESRYVPGQSTYEPYTSYGYYQQFPGYYTNYYYQTETTGYYVEDKIYYIECNLFDAKTQELLFSIQSKTYNPTDIHKISRAYTLDIFKTLEQKGIVKPVSKK